MHFVVRKEMIAMLLAGGQGSRLVNRRLGNCNLLVLVVIIAHLFQKVYNLQKKKYAFLFICYSSRNLLDLDKFHACMEI